MRKFMTIVAMGGALALSQVAMAQTQQPQPVQPSIKATHGAWEVRCYGATDCVMTQVHRRTPETADAVFTVIKPAGLTDNNGRTIEALAEIVVPLGVYLPNGLGLQVDNGEPRAAPFERCIPDGCVVRAPISSAMLGQMRAGGSAFLILSRSPTETVKVPMSLSGFTAAFGSL